MSNVILKLSLLENLHCSLGCFEEDTQQLLLSCTPILDKLPLRQGVIAYEDVFDSPKQLDAVNWFPKLFEVREELLSTV